MVLFVVVLSDIANDGEVCTAEVGAETTKTAEGRQGVEFRASGLQRYPQTPCVCVVATRGSPGAPPVESPANLVVCCCSELRLERVGVYSGNGGALSCYHACVPIRSYLRLAVSVRVYIENL